MAWKSTEEAPPRAWRWQHPSEPAPPDEAAAVEEIHRRVDLRGRRVLDLGCGRGACLELARQLGAKALIGVDSAEGAMAAALQALPSATFVRADAREVPLPTGCADLVWSHGVVEHFREGELVDYFAEARRLSSGLLAFSAPNPANPLYQQFRERHLRAETWEWGYEEPRASYADFLRRVGCSVLYDGDVGREWAAQAPYRPPDVGDWEQRCNGGEVVGICTLVIGAVPTAW